MKKFVCSCGHNQFVELKRYNTQGAEMPRNLVVGKTHDLANPTTIRCDKCNLIWIFDFEKWAWVNR